MVTLEELKLVARAELLRCLDSLPGSKTLIWDPTLVAPFTLFAEPSLLQKHGVDKMVMLPEKGRLAQLPTQSVVFLCKDSHKTMETVCNIIPPQSTADYHLIVVPKLSTLSMKKLKEKNGLKPNGSPGNLQSVIPCQIDIYVLGPYLFTLNIPNSFEKIIQKDQILLSATSRALATLQVAFGTFPYILSLGADSNEAAELIIGKRSEFDAIERKRTGPNQISSLIILDRTVDPVSPLLSPTSYYGLLADELDLKWNSITLKPDDSDAKPKKVSLSPDEPINEELSDVHVKHAARIISQKLRTLKAAFDERHDKKTVAEYKAFVQMMPRLNKERDYLTSHSEMCSKIISKPNHPSASLQYQCLLSPNEPALDRIWSGEIEVSADEALRLFCLSSWRLGGFTQKQIEIYKSEYLSIYGHQNLRHLIRLEEIGLIQVQSEKSSRQVKDTMIKTLKLNEKAKDIFKQTNASYVFDSNWSPITTKLVHEAVSGSWRRISELLNHMNHPYSEKPQNIEGKSIEKSAGIVVFIIGGVTYAEVSALRNLSSQLGVDIIIGSTEIINTKLFLEQIKSDGL